MLHARPSNLRWARPGGYKARKSTKAEYTGQYLSGTFLQNIILWSCPWHLAGSTSVRTRPFFFVMGTRLVWICKYPTHGWITKLLWSRCSSLPITMVQQHKIFNSHSQLNHCHWGIFTSSSPILCPALIHPLSFTLSIANIVKSCFWLQVYTLQTWQSAKWRWANQPPRLSINQMLRGAVQWCSVSVRDQEKYSWKKAKKNLFYELYICYIVEFTIIDVWSCVSNKTL